MCIGKGLTVADNVDSNETLFNGAASTVKLQKRSRNSLVSPYLPSSAQTVLCSTCDFCWIVCDRLGKVKFRH